MSDSTLNLSKTLVIDEHLRKILGKIEKYNRERTHTAVGDPEDGRTRLVLSSPDVCREVKKQFNLPDFRVRFSFATVFDEYPAPMVYPQLEVYNVDGTPVCEPIHAHDLSLDMSRVVELELMYMLLQAKGIEINRY